MAAYVVSADQYRDIDRKMNEIKRQLDQLAGSRLDPDVVAYRLQLIIDGPTAAPVGSTTPEEAISIMGAACHGPDALERHLDVRLSASEAAQLGSVPFSRQTLIESRRTHVLVACARLSLMELRARTPEAFYFKRAWYAEQDFARLPTRTRWRLLRREPVPHSTSKAWSAQQAILGRDELVPGVCELALAIVLHYLATAERLLAAVYVRTEDVDASGRRVGLGRFGRDGLRIRSWGDYPDYYIGLAGARMSSWSRASSAPSHRVEASELTPRVPAKPSDRRASGRRYAPAT